MGSCVCLRLWSYADAKQWRRFRSCLGRQLHGSWRQRERRASIWQISRRSYKGNTEQIIGRGRVIPTTSYDAMWKGVAEWMAKGQDDEQLSEHDLLKVFPNIYNTGSMLYGALDLFE